MKSEYPSEASATSHSSVPQSPPTKHDYKPSITTPAGLVVATSSSSIKNHPAQEESIDPPDYVLPTSSAKHGYIPLPSSNSDPPTYTSSKARQVPGIVMSSPGLSGSQYPNEGGWYPPAESNQERYSLDEWSPEYILNKRRQEALTEVDNAKFSRFHARVCLVAGVGFFTDAYDIFAINIASTMIGHIYGPAVNGQGKLSDAQDFGIKMATQVGTLIGQLVFGWIADIAGRKRMYGIELLIIVFSTLAQALAGSAATSGSVTIVASIIVWRLLMGIGIGGDYPLSAIITSEFAPSHIRGRLMAVVFSTQGLGQLTGTIVALIVIASYEKSQNLDSAWRLLIGLGCVPGVAALYFRFTIPETPRFTMDIARNVAQATQDIQNYLRYGVFFVDRDATIERVQARTGSRRDFVEYFSRMENLKILIGTAYSWFAIDFAFYGLNLNSSIILQAIHYSDSIANSDLPQAFASLRRIAIGNFILTAAGLLPGYIASILLIERLGRKRIQYIGFSALFVIFLIMGAGYQLFAGSAASSGGAVPGRVVAFVFLYCLANFFQNFGPNTTTFIIPGEAFPTRYRSTAHGISAACGKLGAILAQVVVFATHLSGADSDEGLKSDNHALQILLIVCSVFMLSGLASTWLIPETQGRTLEDISNEDQENFITGPPPPRMASR
ncbi:unnamed protein product [Somion occarium]|uniref:Major facilitator superfamily (MFS) profile domain-containing protein n=1 Tax=Somion occarium TaxID=3059160 RepID=A0ABP1EBQ6_9APHY